MRTGVLAISYPCRKVLCRRHTGTFALAAGGLLGPMTGARFTQQQQDSLGVACGVGTLFIGIAGAMQGMLAIDGAALAGVHSMLVVPCIVLGTIEGLALNVWGP